MTPLTRVMMSQATSTTPGLWALTAAALSLSNGGLLAALEAGSLNAEDVITALSAHIETQLTAAWIPA